MAYSGQKTIATAGTELQLGTQRIDGPLMVRALAGNTGVIYIGNDGAGAVASTTGYQLSKGESVRFDHVGSLSDIWVDCATNGDIVCWLAINI